MQTWQALLYLFAVILLVIASFATLAPTRASLPLLAAAAALLAYALPAIATL